MAKSFPTIKFERYADDIVIHTSSAKQSEYLMEGIQSRLKLARLELSLEKSKIVYCVRSTRGRLEENNYPNSFDFLGYTFMPRCSKAKNGELFLGFKPAISKKKQKSIMDELRRLAIQGWTEKSLTELAKILNPKIRGWTNYYGRFQLSEMTRIFSNLNAILARWAKNKFKTTSTKKGYFWMKRVWLKYPNLFAHWSAGFSYKCLS
jgi:RNA-directed DNA polymerase